MLTHPLKLGVNIDHVATLRQVRRATYPDPLYAALVAEQSGADSITLHLREDRRHIQDHDIERLAKSVRTVLNLEMALAVDPGAGMGQLDQHWVVVSGVTASTEAMKDKIKLYVESAKRLGLGK